MDDPEDRELGCDVFECSEWRILVNWQMRSRTRRTLEVCLQYRRTTVDGNIFQMNLLVPTMMEGDVPAHCLHAPHPTRVRSQHRYQIALISNDRHNRSVGWAPQG